MNDAEKGLTRAFVAIEFPDEVVKEIARVQGLLGKTKFTGKMTELENLHLTLKFLGEITDDKLEKAKEALGKVEFGKMKLKLGRIGAFNYKGKPRIAWVKLEGKEIYALQKKIDDALAGLFPKEERFMGHLTIARIKYAEDKKSFSDKLKSIHIKPIEFEAREFKLKKSELGRIGPVYTDIEKYSCRQRAEKYR
jgi:2'-5' RNA ligase